MNIGVIPRMIFHGCDISRAVRLPRQRRTVRTVHVSLAHLQTQPLEVWRGARERISAILWTGAFRVETSMRIHDPRAVSSPVGLLRRIG